MSACSVRLHETKPAPTATVMLVDMEVGRTVLDVSELTLDLQEALGRAVDVVEIRRPSPIADRILHVAVPL